MEDKDINGRGVLFYFLVEFVWLWLYGSSSGITKRYRVVNCRLARGPEVRVSRSNVQLRPAANEEVVVVVVVVVVVSSYLSWSA